MERRNITQNYIDLKHECPNMDLLLHGLHLDIWNCELLSGKGTPADLVDVNNYKQKGHQDGPMCFK